MMNETVRVNAPSLARVVDALWALAENPFDKSAKITVALLEKQGALRCPACGTTFDVRGFRATLTPFSRRRALCCLGCSAEYVVEDAQSA